MRDEPGFEYLGIRRTAVAAENAELVVLVRPKFMGDTAQTDAQMIRWISRLDEAKATTDAANARTALAELRTANEDVALGRKLVTEFPFFWVPDLVTRAQTETGYLPYPRPPQVHFVPPHDDKAKPG
jgi:hypothetical protein